MSDDSILSGLSYQGEEPAENPIRPRLLNEFLGQEDIKSNLRIFIEAAKNREEPLDHVFLSGPPGLGENDTRGYHG